ncbi:MAG: hypothetical protein WCT34_05010 [Patescibacteria group bacterium]
MKVGLVDIVYGVIFPKAKLVNVVAENYEGKPLTSGLPPSNLQSSGTSEIKVVYGEPITKGALK